MLHLREEKQKCHQASPDALQHWQLVSAPPDREEFEPPLFGELVTWLLDDIKKPERDRSLLHYS